MSTKEETDKALAAKALCRRNPVTIGTVTFTLRELLPSENKALMARLFLTGDAGELLLHRPGANPGDDPIPDPAGDKYRFRTGMDARYREEWIAATIDPAYTVDELMADNWPASAKQTLFDAAQDVQRTDIERAAKNS